MKSVYKVQLAYLHLLLLVFLVGCQTVITQHQGCPKFGRLPVDRFQTSESVVRLQIPHSNKTFPVPAEFATSALDLSTESEYRDFLKAYAQFCGGEPKWKDQIAFRAEQLEKERRDELSKKLTLLKQEVQDLEAELAAEGATLEELRSKRDTLKAQYEKDKQAYWRMPTVCRFRFLAPVEDADGNGVYLFGEPSYVDCDRDSPGVMPKKGTLYVRNPPKSNLKNPRILNSFGSAEPTDYFFVETRRGVNRYGVKGLINVYGPEVPREKASTLERKKQAKRALSDLQKKLEQLKDEISRLNRLETKLSEKRQEISEIKEQLNEK